MKTLGNTALPPVLPWIWVILILGMSACKPATAPGNSIFEPENLLAWCIVPFDAQERTPLERAEMLQELGLKHFAYDYRDEHIPFFREEIQVLEAHGIALDAVWLWVDPRLEDPLGGAGRKILDILEETGTRTELWMGLPEDAFEGLPDEASLSRSVELVRQVLDACEMLGCGLALYNHGGWFGEPDNQVRIIESVGSDNVRLVYNFHHAHHQAGRFEELLDMMLPYLSTININGMKLEGPKIITLGEGELELDMLRMIRNSGYSGPIGILGHTEGEDIRPVLERNLEGLEKLNKKL